MPLSPCKNATIIDNDFDKEDDDAHTMVFEDLTIKEILEDKARTSLFGNACLMCLSSTLLLLNSLRVHHTSKS